MSIGVNADRARTDITRLVQEQTANAVAGLIVRVDEGEIQIDGRADSYYVKQLATQAALAASSGRHVRNDIHVVSR